MILFTGGRNDNGSAAASAVGAEAAALFALARTTLPHAACYVSSIFPASATEAADTGLNAVSAAIRTAATGAGSRSWT